MINLWSLTSGKFAVVIQTSALGAPTESTRIEPSVDITEPPTIAIAPIAVAVAQLPPVGTPQNIADDVSDVVKKKDKAEKYSVSVVGTPVVL